ncbi:bifunctional hydroxymethylpyrimidine kinase/phosphomethylpyrimidine kinase [Amphiplicatus metriothermophilus]|uniref:hydroxymethylpyrimidine kinase n=1 Tax=Amphiplicatus metriothermophilus TaxID=1519374 RepID=A0A239PYN3_9PROT|nr:bifunctional hydroxymethylpyrimidine kinase/phosphomethylpyrimidine kinase [Amphiplicatus metriothermophilus]MBB5518183.1 hydroxymethylpyrimidine/phosphomethylpyrimidine kinase [Amphiplicatus metriothermophilus]SNT75345.1 hydroxymethylpyrimidine/phosphomethylpyrimidine kinase [Amphiplicatus metriothermophilus]
MKGRVLIIAGSDPSGGAGVQADIKTTTALGGYAATAITSITVQNTLGVTAVHPVPPYVIREQILAVLDDIGADAVKIGMIGEKDAALAIADALRERADGVPVVLDPVLAATTGGALAAPEMIPVLIERLLPLAALVTPNADEAAALTGLEVVGEDDLAAAGRVLLSRGARAALVKGGHLKGDTVTDVLLTEEGEKTFRNPRIETGEIHGGGCTLASAVATGLAQGATLEAAIARAIAYVREAIRAAPGFGGGAQPLGHAFSCRFGE